MSIGIDSLTFYTRAYEREVIVQIEVWDRFDYTDAKAPNWRRHPYNPVNNVNYTEEESGLAAHYPNHPNANDQPFFFTPPELDDHATVLRYQNRQVDKMLSIALRYPNVLYCIDNETSGAEEWGAYWADRIRRRAKQVDRSVYITEMWDQWNPRGEEHRRTLDRPERYDFVDMSQNNHNSGQEHWDSLMWVRDYIEQDPRPINTVKIYGADGGRFGSTREGVERFWRNILGGCAATRFHRPDSGVGLSQTAQMHIKAARLLLAKFDVTETVRDGKVRILLDRAENEAYAAMMADGPVAVYFPKDGNVTVRLPTTESEAWTLRWLVFEGAKWSPGRPFEGIDVELSPPGDAHAVALITPR